jgi:hypothetical protein
MTARREPSARPGNSSWRKPIPRARPCRPHGPSALHSPARGCGAAGPS